MVGAVSAATTLPPTTSNTNSLSQLSEDYTRFLTLLTAQISNQDPLSPMDSGQFVTQLAQLSQVEQSVKVNTNLQSMDARLQDMTSVAGVGLLGKDVFFSSSSYSIEASGDTASSWYNLPEGATEVSAEIVDVQGSVVRSLTDLPTARQRDHLINWDGRNSAGENVPVGAYTVRISAASPNGDALQVDQFRKETIEAMEITNSQQQFRLTNGELIGLAAIRSLQ